MHRGPSGPSLNGPTRARKRPARSITNKTVNGHTARPVVTWKGVEDTMALRPAKGSARGVTETLMARAIARNVTPVAVKMDTVPPSFVVAVVKDLKVASTVPLGDGVAVKVPANAPDRHPLKI